MTLPSASAAAFALSFARQYIAKYMGTPINLAHQPGAVRNQDQSDEEEEEDEEEVINVEHDAE